MYRGYLSLSGVELVNASRTMSYAQRFVGQLQLRNCHTCAGLRYALQYGGLGLLPFPGAFYPGSTYPNGALMDPDNSYTDPATDFAPWFHAERPASEEFYGLYPLDIQGVDNSTHSVQPIELTTHGAVVPPGRHGPREIRVTGMMIASSDEGMEEGMSWLRSVLDSHQCDADDIECAGRTLEFFSYCPGDDDISLIPDRSRDAARLMYRVEALEGPLVIQEYNARSAVLKKVEFTLIAGVPWRFTYASQIGALTGPTSNQVAHVAYPPEQTEPEIILDPTFNTVQRPPRAPYLVQDNYNPPANWYRYSLSVDPEYTRRWGRGMARVRLDAGTSDRRMVRIRFYANPESLPPEQIDGSDWDGEFIITYMPAGAELVIDGALQRATIGTPEYRGPAGHLLLGSDGRPFEWPSLDCAVPYVIHVDAPVQLNDAEVVLELATRE